MEEVVRTAVRILTFRVSRDELLALDGKHLAFGLTAGCSGRRALAEVAPIFAQFGVHVVPDRIREKCNTVLPAASNHAHTTSP